MKYKKINNLSLYSLNQRWNHSDNPAGRNQIFASLSQWTVTCTQDFSPRETTYMREYFCIYRILYRQSFDHIVANISSYSFYKTFAQIYPFFLFLDCRVRTHFIVHFYILHSWLLQSCNIVRYDLAKIRIYPRFWFFVWISIYR